MGKIWLALLLFVSILVGVAFWFGWLSLSIDSHTLHVDVVLRVEFYQMAKDLKLK